MASETYMPGPVCLIENVKGKLMVNQEALGILSAISQPIVVVAIMGLYRTGKSYLMNKLAGEKKGTREATQRRIQKREQKTSSGDK